MVPRVLLVVVKVEVTMSVQLRVLAMASFALVAALLAPTAHADSVTYTFSGTNTAPGGDGLSVAFQYTAPGFITSETVLFSTQLSSCTDCEVSTIVPAVFLSPANGPVDTVQFNDADNNGSVYAFALGALTTDGTYDSTSPYNPGTLTVTSTPEPNLIELLGIGLIALFGLCQIQSTRLRYLRRSDS